MSGRSTPTTKRTWTWSLLSRHLTCTIGTGRCGKIERDPVLRAHQLIEREAAREGARKKHDEKGDLRGGDAGVERGRRIVARDAYGITRARPPDKRPDRHSGGDRNQEGDL